MSHWTTDCPTKPGWYWTRVDGEEGVVHVEPRNVWIEGKGVAERLCAFIPTIKEWLPIEVMKDVAWSSSPIQTPHAQASTPYDPSKLERVAMNIVNQILDVAKTDAATRQEINDQCDQFVTRLIDEIVAGVPAHRQEIMAQFHKLWGQAHDRTYEKRDWAEMQIMLNRVLRV